MTFWWVTMYLRNTLFGASLRAILYKFEEIISFLLNLFVPLQHTFWGEFDTNLIKIITNIRFCYNPKACARNERITV